MKFQDFSRALEVNQLILKTTLKLNFFGSAWRLLEPGNHNHKGPKDNNNNKLEQKKILPIDQETSNVHTAPVQERRGPYKKHAH